jgi:hypothetical protein
MGGIWRESGGNGRAGDGGMLTGGVRRNAFRWIAEFADCNHDAISNFVTSQVLLYFIAKMVYPNELVRGAVEQ